MFGVSYDTDLKAAESVLSGIVTADPRVFADPEPFIRVTNLGDSSVDMETARHAGMYPVGASWGFRNRQELQDSGAANIIDDPRQLMQLPGFAHLRPA